MTIPFTYSNSLILDPQDALTTSPELIIQGLADNLEGAGAKPVHIQGNRIVFYIPFFDFRIWTMKPMTQGEIKVVRTQETILVKFKLNYKFFMGFMLTFLVLFLIVFQDSESRLNIFCGLLFICLVNISISYSRFYKCIRIVAGHRLTRHSS